jgi:hypothetical protein
VNGKNPLLLLHSVVSIAVHELSERGCLEAARDARVLLFGLAERLGTALKDEAELNSAVVRLAKRPRDQQARKAGGATSAARSSRRVGPWGRERASCAPRQWQNGAALSDAAFVVLLRSQQNQPAPSRRRASTARRVRRRKVCSCS